MYVRVHVCLIMHLYLVSLTITVFIFRYRKMKERLGLTEIRKHANRMTFAEVPHAHAYTWPLFFLISVLKVACTPQTHIYAIHTD